MIATYKQLDGMRKAFTAMRTKCGGEGGTMGPCPGGGEAPSRGDRARRLFAQRQAYKQDRINAYKELKAEADAASGRARASYDSIHDIHGQIIWDSDDKKLNAFTDVDELVVDYDPDGPIADRYAGLKEIHDAALAALKVNKVGAGKGESKLTAEDVASNEKILSQIIGHALDGRQALKQYASLRKEMAAIKRGEELKSLTEILRKCGGPGSGLPGPCPGGSVDERLDAASKMKQSVSQRTLAAAARVGSYLKQKYLKIEERYGKKGAIAMAAAMLVTFPIPFNTAFIIGAAEGVRFVHARMAGKSEEALDFDGLVGEFLAMASELKLKDVPSREKIREAMEAAI